MATIKLFDPDVGTFATKTPSSVSNQGSLPMIELNILIELRVITQYLAAMNPTVGDDPQALRQDVVVEGAY